MSTLTEKARAEADEAEAENPDEGEEEAADAETPEPEPEPAPDPPAAPPAMTEQQAEREYDKLVKLASTYLEKAQVIAAKLGIPVQPCPLDTFPGMVIPRQAHEVTSDLEAAVLGLIGRDPEPEFPEYAGFKRCDICKGTGDVLTGAVIERSRHTTCPNPNCGGKGYVSVPLETPIVPQQTTFPGATIQYTPLPSGTNDGWGRPAGHPHWGLDPAMVGSPNGQQVS